MRLTRFGRKGLGISLEVLRLRSPVHRVYVWEFRDKALEKAPISGLQGFWFSVFNNDGRVYSRCFRGLGVCLQEGGGQLRSMVESS